MSKLRKLKCEKVIEENIGLVKSIVNRINVSSFDKDDLMQAGMIGLWKAAYHFDDKKGYQFSTYATKYIIGEIKEEMKKFQIIKVSRKYYKIINELKKNDKIDEELIMKKTSCDKTDIALAYNLMNNVTLIEDPNQIIDRSTIEHENTKEKKLIKFLSELNDVKKLTQKEIAARLMVSQSTVSRILKKIKEES